MPARGGPCSLDGGQERKMCSELYVYQFYVMDEGWEAFPTISETVKKLNDSDTYESYLLLKFLKFKTKAVEAAFKANVREGYSTDIHVMPLINNFALSYALVWKSGKGGWCNAVSEIELPWISEIDGCTVSLIKNL